MNRNLALLAAASVAASGMAQAAATDGLLKAYVDRFNADDWENHTNAIPNAKAYDFLKANIPLLECPDKDIERAYYFRWWTFRRHIKATPKGYVVTEFLPDVGWAGEYNTINCAAGHHIMEGRWRRGTGAISGSPTWPTTGTPSPSPTTARANTSARAPASP